MKQLAGIFAALLLVLSAGAFALPKAKEITSPDGFINSQKFELTDFVGKKAVLLDFWTYSCINCQRTIPYLNAWHEKYKNKGLVIVGVHTPEFDFEKKHENVLAAVKKFDIKYPVVLDNDHSTWNAYGDLYWPRKHLIDRAGFIVYGHVGEGAYEETEKAIQAALGISADMAAPREVEDVEFEKIESPEIYFGASRNERLGNGRKFSTGEQEFKAPAEAKLNALYLAGKWRVDREFAENLSPGARIVFRYKAKNVYLVASARDKIMIRVLRDGRPQKTELVKEDRLYRLIEGPAGYGEHTIEIIIEKPGVRVFTFTFG